jgi:linoleoyl-CoA desaturase
MQEKSIKFANKQEVNFVNTMRGRVKSYFEENQISRFGNRNMVVKTVFMFTLFFVPYLVMITGMVTQPWLIALCWVVMGFGTAGIGLSVMHDANHRSYSKNQKVNRILAYSLNMVGGFYANWQHQHNTMHHGFTNIDGHDEDIDAGEILRFSPNQPLKKIHRYQHIYAWFLYGLMTITWSINKDFKQLFGYLKNGVKLSREKSNGQLITELFISKAIYYGYLLVLPMILLPIAWWMVLILYFVMHFISGFSLAVIFQTAHVMPSLAYPLPDEKGHISKNWAVHQLMTTTNYAPNNRVLSWLIGALNYQVEHHLFPAICHVHYRKLSAIVRETAKEYGVPYHVQPNFRSALHQHYKMLRTLGRGTVQA